MPDQMDEMKKAAAWEAVKRVESGMRLGLGHGSTAIHALRRIAELLQSAELRDVAGVPCSRLVETQARELGIPLISLEEHPVLDLTIDGADEVSVNLDLIKGGGGALLREKIVAQASRQEIIICDDTKLSRRLGERWALPVEVLPFGWRGQADYITELGAGVTRRLAPDGEPFLSDQGNFILDCRFGPIADPAALAAALDSRAGVLEHGLFIGLASEVIVGRPDGVEVLKPE